MCSVVFEGRLADDDMLRDVGATDLTETSEYQAYLNMKDRNERLEDEIKFLVMRSNVDEDPVKQLQYELEREQRKTQQMSSAQQAKAALLNKIHDLQNVADQQVGTSAKTDEEMKKLVSYMETMQAELTRKRQELSAARHAYHEELVFGRRIDEVHNLQEDVYLVQCCNTMQFQPWLCCPYSSFCTLTLFSLAGHVSNISGDGRVHG